MPQDPAPGLPTPEPLTPAECERVWAWERSTIRTCVGALIALAAAFGIGYGLGGEALARQMMVVWFLSLIPLGLVLPLREKCPRCSHRLSQMWRFQLPDYCRRCGVAFPKRPSRAA